jgi:excinuclease ABC subunit C
MAFDYVQFLANLTHAPGVYRMFNAKGLVLYVGKASNLKKRVSSYFNQPQKSPKTRSMVDQIAYVEITATRSETEALLLESSLIKSLLPKYNVLMRDDKSYPYLSISKAHPFPRLSSMRCKKKPAHGLFFGPYPGMVAIRETLNVIQKVFKIRNCTDPFFNARLRPCLQYQIKRCSAPCTAYIPQEAYQQSVEQAIAFLEGKSQDILDSLAQKMDIAVASLAFEEAAVLRDQIKNLRLIQEQQGVVRTEGDADVVVIEARPGFACVLYVTVRDGQVLESSRFFPSVPTADFSDVDEQPLLWQQVFMAFISFYYLDNPGLIPPLIVTNQSIEGKESIETLLSAKSTKPCRILTHPRGIKARWIDLAMNNLQLAVAEHLVSKETIAIRFEALRQLLAIDKPLTNLICFDISHTQGEATVASCVTFDASGPKKRDYRRYNIAGINPGDDYAAMEQAITRHFKRLLELECLPDVLIVDGGKGQVNVAARVFEALNITEVILIGIAKGPDRKAGLERIIFADIDQERVLPNDSPALHLLQHIRDESHRFAITAHRKKRQKLSLGSSLDKIEGVGPKRRKALLQRFGGLQDLAKARVEEIAKVTGISEALALRIFEHFHLAQ